MNNRSPSLRHAAIAVCCVASFAFGQGQRAELPDTSANHWAYVAIRELANRGLVKGYKNAEALKQGELTRFEFASLVDRTLNSLSELAALRRGNPNADRKSLGLNSLNHEAMNEIAALKDAFLPELEAMKADLAKAREDIEALRADVIDAKDSANKALAQADNSYGAGPGRKFTVSGYIQTRYISASSDDSTLFPRGAPPSSSGYNGNYMEGGNHDSFLIRRSRIKFVGALTPNTKYAIQLDGSGLTSGTNQAVSVREGNITFTPGDGSSKNPSYTIGLFSNPFGFALPQSSAATLWPERPLGFNENSDGIWSSQDYDRGFQVSYGPKQTKFILALINGSGRGSNDTDHRIDQVLRIAHTSADGTWGAGISYYNGDISYAAAPPFSRREKRLLGLDAQYTSPAGPFVLAEYMGGTFEQRTWMDVPTVRLTTADAQGNKIQGYYVALGFNFDKQKPHPWTLAAVYDVLKRSKSGAVDSGSTWDDVNIGYGAIYNLDSATKLKLWFVNPRKVAHPSANPTPKKVGLLTFEAQVKF